MQVVGRETRRCPEEFQARLTQTFGRNIYGEPYFKLAWAQSEFIRVGNIWRDHQGTERRGYRERYLADGTACWCILRWKAPASLGSPETFYENNVLPHTGLSATGEYPYKGRYEVLQALNWKEKTLGKLTVHAMPLSHILIDRVIPMLLKAENLTKLEQVLAADYVKKQKEIERKQEIDEIASQMLEHLPVYYDAVSYSRQGIRTSWLTRRMDVVTKTWNRIARSCAGLGRKPKPLLGMQQSGSKPRLVH